MESKQKPKTNEEKIQNEIDNELEKELSNILPGHETTVDLINKEISSKVGKDTHLYTEKEKDALRAILKTLEKQNDLYENSPKKMQEILDNAGISSTRGGTRKTKKKRSKNKRKTKRRRNKKKRKTKKKRRRRRKK